MKKFDRCHKIELVFCFLVELFSHLFFLKIDFISNQKFLIEAQNIGKLINPTNKYDERRLNLINKATPSSPISSPNEMIINNTQTNTEINQINQDYLRKVNINNLFSRPIDLCFSNNRFTGALLIPEFKYNKLSARATTSSINFINNEYALFSIANRNCLRLISLPEGI